MSELKSQKVPQVKEEDIDQSLHVQQLFQESHPYQDQVGQGFYLPYNPPLPQNQFDNPFSYNHQWMNGPYFPESRSPFCSYVNPYYGNVNFPINPYPVCSNKLYEEALPMVPTASSVAPGSFMHMPAYMPYHHPMRPNMPNLSVQPSLNRVFIQNDEDVEESMTPEIKVEKDSSAQRAQGLKKLKSKMKNETKNIPKNYGKAMISFILTHMDWIQSEFGIQKRQELVSQLKKRKNSINAIVHLKELWTTSKYAKEFRILSNLFLRKYSFNYIFNSRVSNYSTHIKYKYKLQQALRAPGNFSRIKEY